MSDTFSVTAAWNQPSYVAGQTIVGTISGADVLTATTTTQQTIGPVIIPVVAADGAKSSVAVPAVQVAVTSTTSTSESVVIDTTIPIVDNGSPPRAWVVSANKLSITALA